MLSKLTLLKYEKDSKLIVKRIYNLITRLSTKFIDLVHVNKNKNQWS